MISEKIIIVTNDGKNLKTEDEGINIAPAKFEYPIFPNIMKHKNNVTIEIGNLIILLIFT
tara:strand:- start:55 stop:234 length:180 start_codon:yes stop_codon:yes gene_type:complete